MYSSSILFINNYIDAISAVNMNRYTSWWQWWACFHREQQVCDAISAAPILYRLLVYRLYRPKILVSAIGNITKCILVTKILHFYGKIGHKIAKIGTEK